VATPGGPKFIVTQLLFSNYNIYLVLFPAIVAEGGYQTTSLLFLQSYHYYHYYFPDLLRHNVVPKGISPTNHSCRVIPHVAETLATPQITLPNSESIIHTHLGVRFLILPTKYPSKNSSIINRNWDKINRNEAGN
jgi:hypothetical protein